MATRTESSGRNPLGRLGLKPFPWLAVNEYLDTERLRNLSYGNLILRHRQPLFLGYGVFTALSLLALFWYTAANFDIDIVAAGRNGSGNGGGGGRQQLEAIVTMVQITAPPAGAPPAAPKTKAVKPAVKPAIRPAPDFKTAKIRKVRDEAPQPARSISAVHESGQGKEGSGTGNGNGTGSGSGSGAGTGTGSGNGLEGTGDGSIFGTVDKMPAFIDIYKPPFPEAARIANVEGKVFVKVLIDEHGNAIKAVIIRRQPADCTLFDASALKSALRSRFSPGILNGHPVKVWCLIPINFRLDS